MKWILVATLAFVPFLCMGCGDINTNHQTRSRTSNNERKTLVIDVLDENGNVASSQKIKRVGYFNVVNNDKVEYGGSIWDGTPIKVILLREDKTYSIYLE